MSQIISKNFQNIFESLAPTVDHKLVGNSNGSDVMSSAFSKKWFSISLVPIDRSCKRFPRCNHQILGGNDANPATGKENGDVGGGVEWYGGNDVNPATGKENGNVGGGVV